MIKLNDFTYIEDYYYFLDKLSGNNEKDFKNKLKLFDFRDPKIKRKEFNQNRKALLEKLLSKHGPICQLKIHKDCDIEKGLDVDHFIPLSTNELNKRIRKLKSHNGKKVQSQSFGSNHISNLRISCKKCNAYKKHRFLFNI